MGRGIQAIANEVICDGTKLVPFLSAASSRSPFHPTVPAEPWRAKLSARMISRHSFGNYVTVVEQLWAGNPAELWPAAKRMLDAGLSREAVLDRLARAVTP